jgi:rubredoxin
MTQNELKCPKCGSIRLSTVNKKNFRGIKAFTGFLLSGDIGFFEKNSGLNRTKIKCLACNFMFTPSEAEKL